MGRIIASYIPYKFAYYPIIPCQSFTPIADVASSSKEERPW